MSNFLKRATTVSLQRPIISRVKERWIEKCRIVQNEKPVAWVNHASKVKKSRASRNESDRGWKNWNYTSLFKQRNFIDKTCMKHPETPWKTCRKVTPNHAESLLHTWPSWIVTSYRCSKFNKFTKCVRVARSPPPRSLTYVRWEISKPRSQSESVTNPSTNRASWWNRVESYSLRNNVKSKSCGSESRGEGGERVVFFSHSERKRNERTHARAYALRLSLISSSRIARGGELYPHSLG